MARRRSNIARRIAKIRNLPAEEKHLLERIGTIIDSQINNRAPANPSEDGTVRSKRTLPPPKNVGVDVGVHTAKLSWPAVDSSFLSHYELRITNLDTGETEKFISFTNNFIFKGREANEYIATIQSVGRGGVKSPILEKVPFTVADDVFLLEGSKNGFNTLGRAVSEDLFLFENDIVTAWGACTLDRLIGTFEKGNYPFALQLRVSEKGAGLNKSFLIEQIPLFQASESVTCLADTALGFGGINRPALQPPADTDPTFIAGTSFETSISIMFSPYAIPDVFANKTMTFYLVGVGREEVRARLGTSVSTVQEDIVSLSLTLWETGTGGVSIVNSAEEIIIEPPVVGPGFTCIQLNYNDAFFNGLPTEFPTSNEWLASTQPKFPSRVDYGDQFTIAGWVKFKGFYDFASTLDQHTLVSMRSLRSFPGGSSSSAINGFEIKPNLHNSSDFIRTLVRLFPSTQPPIPQLIFEDSFSNGPLDPGEDPTYTAGDPTEPVWRHPTTGKTFDQWHFFTLTFSTANGMRFYVDGLEKVHSIGSTGMGSDWGGNTPRSFAIGMQHVFFDDFWNFVPFNNDPFPAGRDDFMSVRVYQMGMWNIEWGPDPVGLATHQELEQTPRYNWRIGNPLGFYNFQDNLIHYWIFGADKSRLEWVGRDVAFTGQQSGEYDGRVMFTGRPGVDPTKAFSELRGFGPNVSLDSVVADFPD